MGTLIRAVARLATGAFAVAIPFLAPGARAGAQIITPPLLGVSIDDRSGPRFGVAWLTNGSVTAERMNRKVAPVMSLLGWQFEHQFDQRRDLPLPVVETVLLLGGLEQSISLPSASFILGLRQPNGIEAGLGPLFTPAGSSLIIAAGVTQVVGNFNVPVNLAIAPGRRGASISLTTGFNERRY